MRSARSPRSVSSAAAHETEQGERALLNLGHTFGHAFENLTHYDLSRLVHGEGVAIGMASAFRFSRDLGLCSGQDTTRAEAHLRAVGLPTRMGDILGFEASAHDILAAMRQDKKVERGRLTFILVRGIGQSSFVARDLDEASVSTFLARELAAQIWRVSRACITRAWTRAKIAPCRIASLSSSSP